MHVVAAKAVAFQMALQPEFAAYQKQIVANARRLAAVLSDGGLRLVSGGTDNHLMLVDLGSLDLSGKEAEKMLDAANITVNKNGIPFDPRSALVASGDRIGTPAVTTRGMKEEHMEFIGHAILEVLQSRGEPATTERVAKRVADFCSAFPLFASN